MIDRAALVLKWKETGVRWINGVIDQGAGSPVTVDEANEDRAVYWVSDNAVKHPPVPTELDWRDLCVGRVIWMWRNIEDI